MKCSLVKTMKNLKIIKGSRHGNIFFYFFETAFLCATLPVLELALKTRLALNSQRSICFCLPSAGIEGMCHH